MPDYSWPQKVMVWIVILLCAGAWIWGATVSYQGAGIGGLLLWLVLGGMLCLWLFIWAFKHFVEELDETVKMALGFAALVGFVYLVQQLWGVWV